MRQKTKKYIKKSREKWLLKKFLERVKLSHSIISPTDENNDSDEKPDFILDMSGRSIGVEVTEFSIRKGKNRSSEQCQESYRKSIKAEIDKMMEDSKIPTQKIEVSFGDMSKPCAEVITYIISCLTKRRDTQGYVQINEDKISFFKYMRVTPAINGRAGLFYSQSYDCQPPLDVNRLREIIEEKGKKFKNYRKFEENWLLIAFDRTEPAFDQCLNIESFEGISSEGFDRVFLYRTYESDPIMITKEGDCSKIERNPHVVF